MIKMTTRYIVNCGNKKEFVVTFKDRKIQELKIEEDHKGDVKVLKGSKRDKIHIWAENQHVRVIALELMEDEYFAIDCKNFPKFEVKELIKNKKEND